MAAKSNFKTLVPGASGDAGTLDVVSPFDGSMIGSVELADAATVGKALSTAAALHADPSKRIPAWERIAILKKSAELLTERAGIFALESAREGGKPLVDSRVEVARAIDGIHCCIETLRTQHGEEIPMGLNPASANRLAAEAAKMKVGDPTVEGIAIGPLIRPKEADRIEKWVAEAVAAGATVHSGGKRISDSCFEPTVLIDPPADSPVSKQEIFGPVVCLYTSDSVQESIRRANDVPFSFQASVFSRDMDTILKAYRGLDALTVMANDHTAFRVDWMPFGGLRESGLGVGGIPHTMQDMQVKKSLILQSPFA